MPVAELAEPAWWMCLLLALAVAVDAVLPLVPSEVALVGAGALVATGAADPVPVLGAAWLGALAGDCVAYGLGRRAGRLGVGRLLRHRRGRASLVWATRQLDRRTVPVLVAGRFLPGGRTVTTLTAGFLRVSPRRFVPAVALGGALWAGYVTTLGYLGGRGAAEQPWAGALAGLLLVTAAGLTVEGVRRLRSRTEPVTPIPAQRALRAQPAQPAQPREPVPVRDTSSATCS
jgi:membrane protein DedA with SNARE-associated domain